MPFPLASDAGDAEDVDAVVGPEMVEIEKVASKTSEKGRLPEPPDGGLDAWLKVFGGFLMYSNIWGFTLSFGAFQAYYQHNLLSSSSESSISWIGTTQSFLLIMVGVLSGPLFDQGYYRSMLYIGNFLVVFGIMMLSLCKTYYQVFLAQGVCMGLGAGLLYIPSIALVSVFFKRKRSVAMGMVTSGIAVGGVVFIITFDRLTVSTGFPWAIRVMGFITLTLSLLALPALLKGTAMLSTPRSARRLFDLSAWRDPLFVVFTCSTFGTFFGYIVPYFYISTFAQDKLGTSSTFALYILVMSIAGSFFGRLLTGYVAHRMGSMLTWLCCAFISGILAFSWISIETQNTFIAFSVLWGFFSAGLVTLPAATFPNICPDLSLLGTRLGMSWGVSSFASFTGAPIAGALISVSKGPGGKPKIDFLGVQIWSGCCLLLGSCILLLLYIMTVRRHQKGWFI